MNANEASAACVVNFVSRLSRSVGEMLDFDAAAAHHTCFNF